MRHFSMAAGQLRRTASSSISMYWRIAEVTAERVDWRPKGRGARHQLLSIHAVAFGTDRHRHTSDFPQAPFRGDQQRNHRPAVSRQSSCTSKGFVRPRYFGLLSSPILGKTSGTRTFASNGFGPGDSFQFSAGGLQLRNGPARIK